MQHRIGLVFGFNFKFFSFIWTWRHLSWAIEWSLLDLLAFERLALAALCFELFSWLLEQEECLAPTFFSLWGKSLGAHSNHPVQGCTCS